MGVEEKRNEEYMSKCIEEKRKKEKRQEKIRKQKDNRKE